MRSPLEELRARSARCEDAGYSPESLIAFAEEWERLIPQPEAESSARLTEATGRTAQAWAETIREAASPAARRDAAVMLAALSGNCACSGDAPPEPTPAQEEEAAETLARRALAPVRWWLAGNPA